MEYEEMDEDEDGDCYMKGNKKDEALTDGERDILRQEFLTLMQRRFIQVTK